MVSGYTKEIYPLQPGIVCLVVFSLSSHVGSSVVNKLVGESLDLPQVDLMNFRVEYVRPQSGRCYFVAKRATTSREVDLSHLKGFHLRFAPNMRCGMTGNWPDDIWKLNGIKWGKLLVPFRPKISYVCAFLLCQKSKFVYSVLKLLRTKILNEN